jgi:very-short-patch-repair endonuclease
MVNEAAVAALARRQQSMVTLAQLEGMGMSRSAANRRVRSGRWRQPRRGVFEEAAVRPTYARAVMAACLAVGSPVWASHRTAARLHGLEVPRPDAIDLVTPPNRRVDLAGVAHHRSRVLPVADLTHADGVPVTSVARTFLEVVPFLRGRRLALSVDEALRRELLTLDDLVACAARLDGPGRRLVAPLRPVLADLLEGREPGGSRRERELLTVLLNADLPVPVQQHPVVVEDRRYILDFAWPVALVGLEFDGFAEHGLRRSTFDNDRIRENDLVAAGWVLLRATSRTPTTELVDRCRRVLAMRSSGRTAA